MTIKAPRVELNQSAVAWEAEKVVGVLNNLSWSRPKFPTTRNFDFLQPRQWQMAARLMRSAILMLTAVAFALALSGCNEPKAADMVGTWDLTSASRRYLLADLASLSPRLVLGADRRFTATDLPGEFHGSLDVVERYSGAGNWSFITKDGRQQILLNFDEAYGTQFDIANDGGAWKLRYFWGDPDEHKRLEYTKVASGT